MGHEIVQNRKPIDHRGLSQHTCKKSFECSRVTEALWNEFTRYTVVIQCLDITD